MQQTRVEKRKSSVTIMRNVKLQQDNGPLFNNDDLNKPVLY